MIGRRFERIVVPGYELDRPLPMQYKEDIDQPLKKSRYRATQEKNQLLAKKKLATKSASKKKPQAKNKYNNKIKKKR